MIEHLSFSKRNVRIFVGLVILGAIVTVLLTDLQITDDLGFKPIDYRPRIVASLGPAIQKNEWPESLRIRSHGAWRDMKVEYTLNAILQKEADKLLLKYKPDYAAIVAMDPNTGRVLAMSSFTKGDDTENNLALRASFPAASVFKLVTATAALDKKKVEPDQRIAFNGGNHTLYRKNVLSEKINRWTRFISFKEAFARSINAVFARVGIQYLSPEDLEDYAQRYGFNKLFATDMPIEVGHLMVPKDDDFKIAEVASGYNRINKMSPVQGAMMAAAVAADGVIRTPYIVDNLVDESGETVYRAAPHPGQVIFSKDTAEKVQILMGETVHRGTSRKSFREFLRNRKLAEVEVGGKTGSLLGEEPKGKCDWFVGYARNDSQKIAIAAITVNRERWQVKSTYLAQSMMQKFFADQSIRIAAPVTSNAAP
jgi:cell division protein FtsI/penicillin-binding protein 2